uniref:Uncharacterized protein n=1 Tax=Cannabis sativa TaxID=3483 RepID=A0A803RC91_CANSA
MSFYERMGDTLAHQYGGSAAHNKIFSQRRGQWKAATQSQEFFRTLQRYYSNAYMDAEKQDAINAAEEECLCEEFESLINQNHKFLILMLSLLESNLWMYCQLHCSTMSILD